MNRRWSVVSAPLLVLLALGFSVGAVEDKGPQKDAAAKDAASGPGEAAKKPVLTGPAVFDMAEVLAFGKQEVPGGSRVRYPNGQYAGCSPSPTRSVKTYPKLHSKRPLYGSITFDVGSGAARPVVTFHFVLDESGEAEKKAEAEAGKTEKKAGEAQAKKPGLVDAVAKSLVGAAPAPPRFQEAKCPYDLLYFDLNGDGDLTNDGVIKAAEKPAFDLPGVQESPAVRYFSELSVPFDFGDPVGKRPFALVPRARVYGEGSGYVEFIPKMARKGTIRLGGQEYAAWLIQSGAISGRYDRPQVQLEVVPVDRASKAQLTSGPLMLMQVANDQYLTVSASPLGDKLTLTPYAGEFGELEIGAGGRAITEFGAVGVLVGRTNMVPLGDRSEAAETLPRRYKVPVGDYMLPSLTARYGRLRFNARTMSGTTSPAGPAFPIQVRKDKPFVVEFSGKAEVKFMDPVKDRSFKPGEEIYIRAMLNEPFQGIQITGLWDVTKKTGTTRYVDGGTVVTMPEYARLDPTIVIQNSSGEKVAQGTMPFG